MDLGSHVVLITGGASGIGLAMAERFLAAGSEVIICGRREEKLREAKQKFGSSKLHTLVCDLSVVAERTALYERCVRSFSHLNVLVNNAGIQRRVDLLQQEDWSVTAREIAINLEAPIHLANLFVPHLTKQSNPAIINVTSGLAFSPLTATPVYCATKAALHSFTLSLRHQLAKTGVKVIEIIPPAVNTDLGGVGLHTFGVPLAEFADSIMKSMASGAEEIFYGSSDKAAHGSRSELDEMFRRMNPSP